MTGPIAQWAPDAVHGLERREAIGALVEWIAGRWDWDWFVTGTFGSPAEVVTGSGAHRDVRGGHSKVGWGLSDRRWREWVAWLDERQADVGAEAYWIRAREPHQFTNGTHFHALVGGVGKLSRTAAFSEWKSRNGMARIVPADRDPVTGVRIERPKAVVAYVTKYVLKQGGELMFSDNLGRYQR